MSKILAPLFILLLSLSPFAQANQDEIEIISRATWWANEEYRYLDGANWREIIKNRILSKRQQEADFQELTPQERLDAGKQSAINYDLSEIRNRYLLENFADDIALNKIVRENDGRTLAWPQKYTNYVNSIVIHHTEWSYNDSYEAVRKIYQFHSLSRQWWDLWYNYLIGMDGEIFEWRAGWDYVVWAHNKWNNRSTVGIALIGSYQSNEPSQVQMDALNKLVSHLAKKYGIDMSLDDIPIHNTCQTSDCGAKWSLHTRYFHPLTWHRDGWHTACPGNMLYEKIEGMRQAIIEQTSEFTPVKNPSAALAKVDIQARIKKLNVAASILQKIRQKNEYNAALKRFNAIPWDRVAQAVEKIKESSLLTTYIKIQLLGGQDNKPYTALVLAELESIVANHLLSINQVSEKDVLWEQGAVVAYDELNTIKIKLSYPEIDSISISSLEGYRWELAVLWNDLEIPFISNGKDTTSFEQLDFVYDGKHMKVNNKANISMRGEKKIRIQSPEQGYLTIDSWDRKPSWDTTWELNDNVFKWDIVLYMQDKKLVVVNELSLSDYLKWLGEISDFEEPEKIRAIVVAARSYARWYTIAARKFKDSWYDGSDDPDVFQKYLGYGLEKRSPNVNSIVDETTDVVITYDWELIKPWYHSSSDGETVSFKQFCPNCEDKNQYPFLASVTDYSSKATVRKWHGVWIPWTWVSDLVGRWWNYSMIIKYFLPGTNVEKISNPQ